MVATLAKMAVPTYYIESQAAHEGHEVKGPDAGEGYYTGGGKERPGEWYNPTGLFRLKDGGLVYDKKFYALAKGFSPELDGTNLVRNAGSEKRSPGFDLTFSADKSISALWAISRGDEREAIERALIDAAREALRKTVFQHCAATRAGPTVEELRVETGDMLAATFLHRTSRDADPQLHVHSTIFNVVKTHSDGKFRTLHGHPLYAWQKAAGAAFRSHLAHLMRTRLDVEMERHGPEGQYTRVAAMDPDLEREWSKRRAQIVETVEDHLGEEALTNPAQMSAATLATRQRKIEGTTTEEDIARFREEAAEIVDIAELRQRIRETPVAEIGQEFIDAAHEEITAIPAKLAQMDAVFRQPDIVEKVENALGGAVSGDAVERWHELSLAGADLVGLEYKEPNPDAQAGMAHKRIFTTLDTLRAEHTLTRLSHLSVADRAHAVPKEKVDAKLQALQDKGNEYSDEQVRAIRHAASRPGRLALVEGAAGSGKSHMLYPLAELWRGEGKSVRALAVAWRPAVELATAMQAPPSAVYPFLRDVRKGAKAVDADTVLVVDEAGMLSTRQALQLVQLSETTGCKLVLVGDTQQQQPIEAGPGMRIVRDAVGSVRVDRIRRQLPDLEDWLREVDGLSDEEATARAAGMDRAARDAARERFTEMNRQRRKAGEKRLSIKRPWQLGISALLRNGAMHQAFNELHRRGRFGLADGKEEALHDLVERWGAYTAEHPTHSTIVMARTRADVRALSALLRARHHAAAKRGASGRGKDDEIQSAIIRIHRIGERGKAVEANLEVRPGERLRIGTPVPDLALYTGDIVTVTGIEQRRDRDGAQQCRLTVRTAEKRTVSFAPEEIRSYVGETLLDHGYATTATSAQGMTVDAAFLLLDEGMARESTYPACTRHKRHLEVVADRRSVAVGIAGATPDGDPGREVDDGEILTSLGQLCGRSQPKEAAIDHLLAEKRLEMELEGEIEIGREPGPGARAANDGLDPGTAGVGPHDPATSGGAAARRHADRAAVERIVAAADRRTDRSADLATAVALAADMDEVEREWTALAAPVEPVADPETAGEVRRTLDRHRNVLNRVRVFLRSRTRGSEDGKHHPRVSGLGYDAFAGLGRSMQRRWRETLRTDDARLAAEAEKQARTRSRSEALERDWDELRSRTGQEPLAFLEDPEHPGLLRRTVELATDREIDRDTARSWRAFLDGHYDALGAELTQAWVKATPLRQDTGGALTPENVSGYGVLMRQAQAFRAALPGDRKAEHTLWRRRIDSAPAYEQVLRSLAQSIDNEDALIGARETLLAGSTLPTRRLADHMTNLDGAARLPGFPDAARKEIRRVLRGHREARKEAGITRTDAPWPSDEQIEDRIGTGRRLREGWRALNEAKRGDPLAALDHPDHTWLIHLAVRQATDPSLDADTARKQTTYLARHLQEMDAALEQARFAVREPTASPGWRHAELRQYDRLRSRAARLTVALADLPDDFVVPGIARGKWWDWLSATPDTPEASDMLLRSIRAEDAAIRERETLLPGSALPTRRLHDHMGNLKAITGSSEITSTRERREERHEFLDLLKSWETAREAAGVTRADGQWLSDKAAAMRAEERALDKAWQEIRPGNYYDNLKPLDLPDHGDIIARTTALAAELEGGDPARAQEWRQRVEIHVSSLAGSLGNICREHMTDTDLRIDWHARSYYNFNRLLRLPARTEALAGILRDLPPGLRRPRFDLQALRTFAADRSFRTDVGRRLVENLFKQERAIREREAAVPGSTLPTRRLARHMALLEALASHDLLSARDRKKLQDVLDAHRQARADAGVTATDRGWASSPAALLDDECRRIQGVFDRAWNEAGGKAVIYTPGILELRPDIDRLLANPHLSAGSRRVLEDRKTLIRADILVRNEVDRRIERARDGLRDYTAILDRHRTREAEEARRGREPAKPARRGLLGWMRRTPEDAPDLRPHWDPARIKEANRRKKAEGLPVSLADLNDEFLTWTHRNGSLLKTFETWLAGDDPQYADHVDRRRIDIADVHGELAAIQRAVLNRQGEPHLIEIPDAGRSGMEDQRFDAKRVKALLPDALRPRDERDRDALVELARWNRAWPKQTLAAFRAFVDDAERRRLNVSDRSLAQDLPPALAAGIANLSEESYKRHARVLALQQELTRGLGRSM